MGGKGDVSIGGEAPQTHGYKNNRKPDLRKFRAAERVTVDEIKNAAQDLRHGFYFDVQLRDIWMRGREVKGGMKQGGEYILRSKFETPEAHLYMIGGFMETANAELKLVNEEVTESKRILQSVYNEVRAVHDQVEPELIKQIAGIRNARMAIVSETQTMLTMLRDIRKFFLESDYEKEVYRLKEFISICKDLEGLKKSGVLDAVSDTIIKLATKESEGR
jgi:hypothetical protein